MARRSLFDLAPGATGIMRVMTIEAVAFDIGGVLEITPDMGVTGMWESRLGLGPGELNKRMSADSLAWRQHRNDQRARRASGGLGTPRPR